MPIITSPLDTDLYKLSMGQAVFHQFPDVSVEYEFKNRTKGINLWPIRREIEDEIEALGKLRYSCDDISYLRSLGWFKESYLSFLKRFYLDPSNVTIYEKPDGHMGINTKGYWANTIYYETLQLPITSETYMMYTYDEDILWKQACDRLDEKMDWLNNHAPDVPFNFADFGTRRRMSKRWQEKLVDTMKDWPYFIGSSNVYFARQFKVKPIGTMAHEWIMAGQGLKRRTSLLNSQRYMLQCWADEYRGDLGIAITDTLGFNAFLNDFDMYFAKLFDGGRHDSGEPIAWGEKFINKYKRLNINPMTKNAPFSDGLNFEKSANICEHFRDRINTSFGIGTWLTNDCGEQPLQIVIKMTKCNGFPVAKISDSPGKQMCEDENHLKDLRSTFKIERR